MTPRTRSGTQGGTDDEWRKTGVPTKPDFGFVGWSSTKNVPKNLLSTHPRCTFVRGFKIGQQVKPYRFENARIFGYVVHSRLTVFRKEFIPYHYVWSPHEVMGIQLLEPIQQ